MEVDTSDGIVVSKMRKKKVALLISNEIFLPPEKNRTGTPQYVEFLNDALINIEYSVSKVIDGTKDVILKKLEKFAEEDANDTCCIVVIVMTHGEQGGLFLAKNTQRPFKYYASDIWKPFSSPKFDNVFKLFMFLACRPWSNFTEDRSGSSVRKHNDSVGFVPRPPTCPNTLVVHSSLETRFSFPHLYVPTLREVWRTYRGNENVLSFFTTIHLKVVENQKPVFQTPIITSSLHQKFYVPSLSPIESVNATDSAPRYYPWPKTRSKLVYIIHTEKEQDKAQKIGYLFSKMGFTASYTTTESITEHPKTHFNELSQRSELNDTCCFILVIIAEMRQRILLELYYASEVKDFYIRYGTKYKQAPLHQIWRNFTSSQCLALTNVPKLFFFINPSDEEIEETESDVEWCSPVNDNLDTLMFYGLGQDCYKKLVSNLPDATDKNIFDILASAKEQDCSNKNIKHLSYFESTLRFQLIFKDEDFREWNEENKISSYEHGLLLAATTGREKFVKIYIESGTNINCVDVNGNCPLILAAKHNHENVVTIMLHNSERDVNKQGQDNMTALHWACHHTDDKGLTILQMLLTCHPQIQLNQVNSFQETALNIALRCENSKITRKLKMQPGVLASLNYLMGEKLRSWAERNKCSTTHEEALLKATQMAHLDIVKIILELNKTLINCRDVDGRTPLHIAAQMNYFNIAQFLVKEGADINSVDNKHNTPSHYSAAYFNNHQKLFQFLSEQNGVNFQIKNVDGQTPIQIIADSIQNVRKD